MFNFEYLHIFYSNLTGGQRKSQLQTFARNVFQGRGTARDQSCQVLNYQASCGGHKPGEHNVKALVGRIKFEINSFMIDGTKSTFKNLESLK